MQYIDRTIETLDWVTLIMVACFVVLAILKVAYPKRFEEFIKLPVSNNYFLAKGKSEEIRHPFTWFLFGFQIITISLFMFLFFSEEAKSNSMLFVQLMMGVIAFIIIKISVEKIIGSIFSIEKIIDQYIYEKLTYRNLLAILLFIANLIFYYSIKPDLQILLIFTGVIVLFNMIILYSSYKKHNALLFSNFFYFLLYLCTLEISPYVILYKALV